MLPIILEKNFNIFTTMNFSKAFAFVAFLSVVGFNVASMAAPISAEKDRSNQQTQAESPKNQSGQQGNKCAIFKRC